MSMFDGLISKLKEESRTIVFTEGTDRRILEATSRLLGSHIMNVVLVGNVEAVKLQDSICNFCYNDLK